MTEQNFGVGSKGSYFSNTECPIKSVGISGYVSLVQPNTYDEKNPKFTMDILYKKNDPAVFEGFAVVKATVDAMIAKFYAGQNVQWEYPYLRDGDTHKSAAYHGHWYIATKADPDRRPACINAQAESCSHELIKPGSMVRAIVQPNLFKDGKTGLLGVSYQLKSVQFISEGEPLNLGESKAGDPAELLGAYELSTDSPQVVNNGSPVPEAVIPQAQAAPAQVAPAVPQPVATPPVQPEAVAAPQTAPAQVTQAVPQAKGLDAAINKL